MARPELARAGPPFPRAARGQHNGRVPSHHQDPEPPGADDLTESVLDCVAEIPLGPVSTYGRVAAEARARCGRGGARNVGQILSRSGGQVPWWRVVSASGAPAAHHEARQLALLAEEAVPMRDERRVDLRLALHAFTIPSTDR